jgi:hypothetical protein
MSDDVWGYIHNDQVVVCWRRHGIVKRMIGTCAGDAVTWGTTETVGTMCEHCEGTGIQIRGHR